MKLAEKIRPIYSELQGYLSQIPSSKIITESTSDASIWNQYNSVIDELNQISEKNYDRFKIQPQTEQFGFFITILTYRQKLGGLISRLHGEFFSNEPAPFSGMPSTIISQSQQQNQLFRVEMVLEVQRKLDENIPKYEEGSKERGFLEKIKSSLASITNVTQLIALIFTAAKECGLDFEQLSQIFK